MNKGRAANDQPTNSMPVVSRQTSSPQHKICLPRTKAMQSAKTINPQQQQMQIPIYLNEAQLALLNSKHSPKEATSSSSSRQYTAVDQGKTTITTAKAGPISSTIPSTTMYQQQQQQLLAQHLHQHQTSHNYVHHQVASANNPDITNTDHSNTNNSTSSGAAVSYLIGPNLLVSHNQLSQLTPRDLAILQQKLLHQQHLYQHQQQQQQQMQASSSSNQHLMCTCPSELHRAMHAQQQQQQQQQQQRLLEQRKLLAAQLSAMHGGPQIKLAPMAANTLPRDLHNSSYHGLHQTKSDGLSATAAVATGGATLISQGHLCQNHQLSLQRQVLLEVVSSDHGTNSSSSATVASSITDNTDNSTKEVHTCSLSNSGDSGYSSTREQPSTEVDSQITNLIAWIESVYGIKLVDYVSKNYSLQSQNNIKSCSDGSREINGNDLGASIDPQRMQQSIVEFRSELSDLQLLVKRQYEFFKNSMNQISSFIQGQSSQHIGERIKLFEYNQAVLAHKIQTVHTTLSSYLSSEEKYQPEVINNISRNVSDINDDYSKLQENYVLIEKPVKCNIEGSSQSIDKHQSILTMVSKAMIASQGQLNTLNYAMTDLIRKQSMIKPPRKIASLPEEALDSVIALREELHRAILAMTPDLEKRQSAYELLERFLMEKTRLSPPFVEAQGKFEEMVDAQLLSVMDDMTPTSEDGPDFQMTSGDGTPSSMTRCVDDDYMGDGGQEDEEDEDHLPPPPPPIESVEDSPVPITMTDHLSHMDMNTEAIPMIDETPSSESFDDVCFNEPTIVLVKSSTLKKKNNMDDDPMIDSKQFPRTGTILKTSSGTKTSKTNKVVFNNTVTVEDGSETIRLNCPSEESDLEDRQNGAMCPDELGSIRKNPAPPPPPRRTSQISGGGGDIASAVDQEINYEELDSYTSSDLKHHVMHHGVGCGPLSVVKANHSMMIDSGAGAQTGENKRRLDPISIIKPATKPKPLSSPSENDVWQRQTEFNTGRHGTPAPTTTKSGLSKATAASSDQKTKPDKPPKRK